MLSGRFLRGSWRASSWVLRSPQHGHLLSSGTTIQKSPLSAVEQEAATPEKNSRKRSIQRGQPVFYDEFQVALANRILQPPSRAATERRSRRKSRLPPRERVHTEVITRARRAARVFIATRTAGTRHDCMGTGRAVRTQREREGEREIENHAVETKSRKESDDMAPVKPHDVRWGTSGGDCQHKSSDRRLKCLAENGQ
ncbi:hypothetical protein EYF80_064409 [Liparis tanakae]|uniref:Uncharacterized protein n=1 Tax=Liparis tanakae TaxID=230148 RepID=A0A4Z2E9H4_9TELE|nr:hypothetical protein EYF80_064409 [Liparis tanakae]